MDMEEKKIDGEIIYDGKVVKLIKDKVLCPNKKEAYREIVKHNGGSAILPITKDNKILLIKQFRYAYNEVLYEIPAGKLELNEDPYSAALRELEEETGFKVEKLESLGIIYPTCGYTKEKRTEAEHEGRCDSRHAGGYPDGRRLPASEGPLDRDAFLSLRSRSAGMPSVPDLRDRGKTDLYRNDLPQGDRRRSGAFFRLLQFAFVFRGFRQHIR